MLLNNRHLTQVSFKDPYLRKDWTLKDNNLLVRGTPGAGDFMFTMSTAFYLSNMLRTRMNLIFYWEHGPDYEHHFEDPESIFEKIDFFHSICYKNEMITYEHIYNFETDDLFQGQMLLNLERSDKSDPEELNVPKGLNSWKFKPHIMNNISEERKIALWRFRYNAETPSAWKRSYTNDHWDQVHETLIKNGWNVVELCYRTPIREVLYHMQTAKLCMGYDGMWHYMARMLYKPTIITGDSTIVNVHNPQAMPFFSPEKDAKRSHDLMSFVEDLDNHIDRLYTNLEKYVRRVDRIIENR